MTDENVPIYSMVPRTFSSSKDSFIDGFQAEVGDFMESAGYSPTNKYEMDFWYSPTHYSNDEIFVADILKYQIEATGYFKLNLKNTEWGSYVGQLEIIAFFLLSWRYDYPDQSNYIDPFVGAGAFSLGTIYTSTKMDSYLTTMHTNVDHAVRQQSSKSAQDLMAEEVKIVPLFSMSKQFSAMDPSVVGNNLEPSQNVHYNSISVFGSSEDSSDTNYTLLAIAVDLVVLFEAKFWFLRRRKSTSINYETSYYETSRNDKEKSTGVTSRFCRGCGTEDQYKGTFCSECGMTLL